MAKLSAVRGVGRSMALATIERVPVAAITRLPSQGGTAGRTAVLVQAARLRLASRPEDALRLLNLLGEADLPARGHLLRAQALEDTGDLDAALTAARQGTAGAHPEVPAVLTRLRVARASDAAEDIEACLALACRAEPRNASDAGQLVKAFRSDDENLVQEFLSRVSQWTYRAPVAEQIRLDTDLLLARGASEQNIADAAVAEAAESADGLLRAVHRIAPTENWPLLAQVLGGRTVAAEMAKDLSRYAGRALKAGWTAEAAVMAESAIRSGTGMNQARAVHAQAMEQQFIIASGWSIEPAREPSYEPDPRSTLSVLAQSLPHRSGGYATRSHGILTGLRARGWQPQAVTRLGFPYDRWPVRSTDEVSDHDTIDGIAYHRLLEPGERAYLTTPMSSYIERFAARIMAQATTQRACLIHASSFQNNGLAGLTAARRLGIPFIYEMRGLEDLMKISRNAEFGRTGAYEYMVGLENHIVAHADLTLVITEALREEMISRGGPGRRIEVLPNGVHTSDFEPRERDEALLDELGLSDRTIIGYAGGLVDYEGLGLLVEAAAELKAHRSDFAVVIVGDGHVQARLHRQVEHLGVADVVRFTGRVPHTEVARYLSTFDITPFPRLPLPVCELISPIKPFEAMSMGKAVIASSVAALTEIVEPDVRGLIFDKGDSVDLAAQLDRYLDSPELRDQMGRAARAWVLAERDWSDVVEVADTAYHQVLAGGGATATP
ncbi:hypothetical protein BH23ACT6_BH23ACT6_11810 [soil metagenome]